MVLPATRQANLRAQRVTKPPNWFARHGQTTWNVERRLQGQRDTELNATGLAQAIAAAGRLRKAAGERLEGADFVASPLTRARRTMSVLRAELGLDPEAFRTDERLKEIGFGAWEGSTWAEIRRWDPSGAAARDRDRWHYRPKGDSGESYAMVAARVAALVAQLDRPTIIVAHGGVARALLVTLGHLDIYAAPRLGIRQGSILAIDEAGWRWT